MPDGLNIAQRPGEGDAYAYNWQPFHNTLERIYQRDMIHQTALKGQADRSAMEMQQAQNNIRAVDIPDFRAASDKFTDANIKINDRSVQRDPQQLAYWMKQRNDNLLDAKSVAQRSKDAIKFKSELSKNVFAKQGVGFHDSDTMAKLYSLYDNTPAKQISANGLDNPNTWLLPPDTMPHDMHESHVFGKRVTIADTKPVYDGKTLKGYEKHSIVKYENDPVTIAHRTLDIAAATHSMADYYKQIFQNDYQRDPQAVQSTISEGEKLTGIPLPKDAYGYAAAMNALKGKPQDSIQGVIEDPFYKQKQQQANQWGMLKYREGRQDSRQQAGFHHTDNKAEAGAPFDPSPMYEAALKGDSPTVNAYGSTIARDTNKNYVPVSRMSILNQVSRRKIKEAYGISDEGFKVGGTSLKDKNDFIEKYLSVINKTAGSNIRLADLDKGKIVPTFTSKGFTPDPITKKPTAQIYATVHNPNIRDRDEFSAGVSQIYRTKNKRQYSEMYQNLPDTDDELRNLLQNK